MSQPHYLNFANKDLRNRSFKGQDLTGADFSGSDIRGCNFSNAKLVGASFESVKAGLTRKQVITLMFNALVGVFLIPLILCINIVNLIINGTLFISFGIASWVFLGGSILFVITNFRTEYELGVIVSNCILISVVASVWALNTSICLKFGFSLVDNIVDGIKNNIALLLPTFAILLVLLSITIFLVYSVFLVFKKTKQLIINSIGTSFRKSNLTNTSFEQSIIQNSDFSRAILTQVNWSSVELSKCRFDFKIDSVKKLCMSRNGQGEDYEKANMREKNLVGVFLNNANLRGADLSKANLERAELEKADLSKVKALETNFFEASLTSANFTNSDISRASLRYANLVRVDFTRVIASGTDFSESNLAGANFSQATLEQANMVQANIMQANFSQTQASGADFSEANLFKVNFGRANLIKSNLRGANLEHANLNEIQALGTDFSGARLTGACIKNWGINPETKFENVECKYIYLKEGNKERKPDSGEFQKGDFEKLIAQSYETIDLLFRGGIDPQAFDFALRELIKKHREVGICLKSIEDLGDGDRVVRLKVENPQANKAVLHEEFFQDYKLKQEQLAATKEQLADARERLANAEGQLIAGKQESEYLKELVRYQVSFSRPALYALNSQFIGDPMADKSNKIQFGNVGGDVSGVAGGDNSGVAGQNMTGVAGGDISGTVTNTINQLQESDEPEAPKLADLLKQLQEAIAQPDAGLGEKDQEKALKHLDAIGKLGSDRNNPDLREAAENALDALPTIMKRGAGLLEFAETYLPTITNAIRGIFGF